MNAEILSEADNFDAKWKSISIGDGKYSICASERNGTWKVSMTNLIEIWTEELDRGRILQKCEKLNPNLSIEDIDVHQFVCKILQDIPKYITNVSVEQIKLSCELEGGVFQFSIDFERGTNQQLWEEVTMPLCLAAGELRRRHTILLELVKKKDAEISEYKLNGAELIRKHIKTEPFHEDVFKKNAPTQNAESCHDAFQRIMELHCDVKMERHSVKTEPTKTCFPASLVQAVINTAANDKAKSINGKRFRHTLLSVEGPARKKRRRCVECYRKRRQSGLSATDAASLTKQVKTYCNNCSEKPHLCLPCFNSIHENIPTGTRNIEETLVKVEVEEHPDENNIDLVLDTETAPKIEDNQTPETVNRESNVLVPKVEINIPPESSQLAKPSKSESEIKNSRMDTRRTRSAPAVPTKRTKKNIHDFIK